MSIKTEYTECPSESLDLFSTPIVQSDVDYFKDVEYFPQTAALNSSKQTVVFDIPAQPDHMIDLNHSYFVSTLAIKKANGADIGKTTAEFVGVVNNIGQSMWKQIELVLNDTPVTEANGMYAYQSYLETMLSFDETKAENYLKMTNWASDTLGKEDAAYPTNTASAKNQGLNTRSAPFDDSEKVKVLTKPHVNICNQLKYLLPGVRLQWRLSPNSNLFCLMSKTGTSPQLFIYEVKLILRHIHVKDAVLKGIERTLMKTPANYPLCQPHMTNYLVPAATTSWVQDNVFNGKVPNRLFFALVDNSAFNGSSEQNPFNFVHGSVSGVQVTVNNQEVTPPLRLDYDDNDYFDAYSRLLTTLGNSASLVDYERFNQGSAIYGFDLTPKGNCADEQYLLKREGNLRISINFATAVVSLMNIVVLGEFDRTIKIDSHKNIIRDW